MHWPVTAYDVARPRTAQVTMQRHLPAKPAPRQLGLLLGRRRAFAAGIPTEPAAVVGV